MVTYFNVNMFIFSLLLYMSVYMYITYEYVYNLNLIELPFFQCYYI